MKDLSKLDRPDDPPFCSLSEAKRLATQVSINYGLDFDEFLEWMKSGITRREFFMKLAKLKEKA